MPGPILAIVGRPNVGKSTLFNRLSSRRAAIVEDTPGVTRDRIYAEAFDLGRNFTIIDTGGFEPETDDRMLIAMRDQARIAIEEAHAILFVMDGTAGLLPADEEIAHLLRRGGKPVFYAVNKIDGPRHDPLVAEFWSLGVPMLWPISAQHGGGVYDLLEGVLDSIPPTADEREPEDSSAIRVAVVGKPNAGKSTLVNRLLGKERLIVDDTPGTTRDSIDSPLTRPPDPVVVARVEAELAALTGSIAPTRPADGSGDDDSDDDDLTIVPGLVEISDDAVRPQLDGDVIYNDKTDWAGAHDDADDDDDEEKEDEDAGPTEEELQLADLQGRLERARAPREYVFIDTAGVRRRKWIKTALERYSVVRSFKAIDRAEVCVMMIDATEGVTDQDARIAGLVDIKGRAAVLLLNKWDAVPDKDDHTIGHHIHALRTKLKFMSYAPIVTISAETGQRVHRIFREIDRVHANWNRRVGTGALNRFIDKCVERQHPPIHKGRRLKFYFASQVATAPPTFLLMVNDRDAVHFSYQRFLANQIRGNWDFEGTPIRLFFRNRRRKKL